MNWSCAQKYLFYWVIAYSSSPSVNSLRFFHWLLFRAWICSQSLFTPNSPLSVCIPPAEHRALLKPFDTCWTAALDGMRYTTMLLRKLISFASLALLFFTLRASSSLLCLCVCIRSWMAVFSLRALMRSLRPTMRVTCNTWKFLTYVIRMQFLYPVFA